MEDDKRETKPSTVESHPRTGGEWFLKILQANGIRYIFGTTGGGMPDIQDAMAAVKSPVWVQGLHEFPTVAAAMGYALASEKPAVCLIDRVVGTTNALGAFYAAYQNFSPVVIFASQNLPALASGHLSDGRPQFALHYHSWQSIFPTPWTKWRYELSKLDMLPSSVQKALMIAVAEPSGPTYMTLRQDLMAKRISDRDSAPIYPGREVFSLSKMAADEESVKAAAKLLVNADRPIIWATSMGRHVSSVSKLLELAETLGCGVLDGRNFFNFPMDHPLFLGFYTGITQSRFIEEADVLLNIENYYEPPFKPPIECEVIDIYPDPAMLQGRFGGDYGGTLYPSKVRLVGDSTTILVQLVSAVRKDLSSKSGFKRIIEERFRSNEKEHENNRSRWIEEERSHLKDDPVSPHRIAHELNKLWNNETIWVNQTITMSQPLLQGITLNKPGTYFTNPSGHLGSVAGAAYGVSLARPRERVVAMMGDGDFIFGNPSAVLWTCSHYHIPVLFLVFNNACWGIGWVFIKDTTLRFADECKDYECVDLVEPRLDFKGIAEAFGVHAETVKHPDEAYEKLRRGLERVSKGLPALVDIHLAKYTEGESSYRYVFKRPS